MIFGRILIRFTIYNERYRVFFIKNRKKPRQQKYPMVSFLKTLDISEKAGKHERIVRWQNKNSLVG